MLRTEHTHLKTFSVGKNTHYIHCNRLFTHNCLPRNYQPEQRSLAGLKGPTDSYQMKTQLLVIYFHNNKYSPI